MIDIKELQTKVRAWELYNFGKQKPYRPLLGIVEELGELSHAHLKAEQNIRQDRIDPKLKKMDALGDMFIYMLNYATHQDIDLDTAIEGAWENIKYRDWKKFPFNGRTE